MCTICLKMWSWNYGVWCAGEGVFGNANRRGDREQRGGHPHLYCQHTSARLHWQVKAAEGKHGRGEQSKTAPQAKHHFFHYYIKRRRDTTSTLPPYCGCIGKSKQMKLGFCPWAWFALALATAELLRTSDDYKVKRGEIVFTQHVNFHMDKSFFKQKSTVKCPPTQFVSLPKE